MRPRFSRAMIGALLLGVVLIAALAIAVETSKEQGAKEEAKSLSLDQVPAVVQATIKKEAADAQIKKIELENENGKEVYTVEILKDNKESEFSVAPNGDFLGFEQEENEEEGQEQSVDFAALPAAVKAAAEKHFGAGSPFKATKEAKGKITTYEIAVEKDGMEQSIDVSEAGNIAEVEKQIPASELPATVLDKIKSEFPAASIKKVTEIKKTIYELDLTINGQEKEVKASPSGKLMSHDEEGEKGKACEKGKKEGEKGEEKDED
jgi:uncharacterized membrane protein YkoI